MPYMLVLSSCIPIKTPMVINPPYRRHFPILELRSNQKKHSEYLALLMASRTTLYGTINVHLMCTVIF